MINLFSQKFFGKLKMDIYKCPKLKYRNISWKKEKMQNM